MSNAAPQEDTQVKKQKSLPERETVNTPAAMVKMESANAKSEEVASATAPLKQESIAKSGVKAEPTTGAAAAEGDVPPSKGVVAVAAESTNNEPLQKGVKEEKGNAIKEGSAPQEEPKSEQLAESVKAEAGATVKQEGDQSEAVAKVEEPLAEDEDGEDGAEQGEDEMEEGEEELEEIIPEDKNQRMLRAQSISGLKKQLSIQSVRGGIQGNEGVIGEDGEIEKDSDEEDDEEDSIGGENGMRTRQSKMRIRKKAIQEKAELSRTRHGGKANDDQTAKVGGPSEGNAAEASPAKKPTKVVTKPKVTKPAPPQTQAQNSSSSANNGSSLLGYADKLQILDIKANNENQKQIYRDVLPKFLYSPFVPLPDLSEYTNRWIEIRVHKSYVCRQNKAVRHRAFYGVDQYTSDSDIVCILQHTGYLRIPDYEVEDQSFDGYSVVFKVRKSKAQYTSQTRNFIKSRKASAFDGHAIKLESVCKLEWLGSDEELLALARKMPTEVDTTVSRRAQKSHLKAQIALNKAADSVYRALSEAKVFNLSLEIASQYNLCRFVDRGPNERTSDRLRTNVLYFETPAARYELARFTNADYDATYRLAEVADPFFKDESFFAQQEQIPLTEKSGHLRQVLAENLEWSNFLWGIDSLKVVTKDQEDAPILISPIVNFLFRPSRKQMQPSSSLLVSKNHQSSGASVENQNSQSHQQQATSP